MNSTDYKPKQARLRGIPKDVYDIIRRVQLETELQCNCQFSQEQTIYKLIRKSVKEEKDGTN